VNDNQLDRQTRRQLLGIAFLIIFLPVGLVLGLYFIGWLLGHYAGIPN